MRRSIALLLVAGLVPFFPEPATAQILKDLPALELEYAIFWGDPDRAVVGSATVTFRPVDSKRGRRLEVNAHTEYKLPRATPFEYAETVTLVCDGTGVTRFETTAKALGKERVNVAIRQGEDFHVTTEFAGKKHSKTITAGVRRTNFGLFAGGFLAEPLDTGGLMQDFPILYPVGGDHKPRQKVRDAILPFGLPGGKKIRSIQSTIRKPDKSADRIWNTTGDYQILLRMEEKSSLGVLVYELTSVNGQSPDESELIQ